MASVKAQEARTTAESGRTFVKARRVRSFDDVVDQVRAAIIDGSILAGERLPSERELAEQFGVSRATLREALRALEAVGLIEIRLGAHGGAFATEGALERTAESLRHVVEVEVATRPDESARFRASLHADNATWFDTSGDHLSALADAIARGSRAFLIALAEGTGMPLRVALAAAVEHDDPKAPQPALTERDMERVVHLLEAGRRQPCTDLLYDLLGQHPEEDR